MMELEQPTQAERLLPSSVKNADASQSERGQLCRQRHEDLESDTQRSNQQEKIQTQKPKRPKRIDKKNQARNKNKRKCALLKSVRETSCLGNKPNIQTTAQQQRQIPTKNTFWDSEMQGLQGFHQEIDKTYFVPVTSQQFQRLKQRKQPKHFHIVELLNSIDRKIKLSHPHIINYLRLLKDIRKDNSEQINLLYQNQNKYAILFYNQGQKTDLDAQEPTLSLSSYLELTYPQFALLKMRHIYMKCLEKKLEQYNQNRISKTELDQISRQTLFFGNLLELESKKIDKQVEILQAQARKQLQEKQKFLNLLEYESQYISLILKKCVKLSLVYQNIDILNYFKMRACLEQHKQFEPFISTKELNQYIKKKMIKKNKKTKNPLPTACKGCLSNNYEQYNPFSNCYQCGSRFHRLCLSITNNICTVCQGRKLKRTLTPECCLCTSLGLMYKSLNNSTNVHVWCALAFNEFQVKNKIIEILTPSQRLQTGQQCFLCLKSTGRVISCSCQNLCGKHVHPMCAYLNGYHLEKADTISFNCQIDSEPQQLIEQTFYRSYILNHSKTAYNYYSVDDYKKSKQGRQFTKTCKSVTYQERQAINDEDQATNKYIPKQAPPIQSD